MKLEYHRQLGAFFAFVNTASSRKPLIYKGFAMPHIVIRTTCGGAPSRAPSHLFLLSGTRYACIFFIQCLQRRVTADNSRFHFRGSVNFYFPRYAHIFLFNAYSGKSPRTKSRIHFRGCVFFSVFEYTKCLRFEAQAYIIYAVFLEPHPNPAKAQEEQ